MSTCALEDEKIKFHFYCKEVHFIKGDAMSTFALEDEKVKCHFYCKVAHFQRDGFILLDWLKKKSDDVFSYIDEFLYIDYAINTW